MPHSRKRNPEIGIMTAKLEVYFILGPIATIRYISTIISMFAEKCQALCTPSPCVCIDKTLVGFRGRCPFRVYIPSKPDRYGLKIWSMCDVSSNYLYNLQAYLGKEGESENSSKEPELYVIWQLWFMVPPVTLPLTISSRRTHWPSSCSDKT